jgi:hypothetical protein
VPTAAASLQLRGALIHIVCSWRGALRLLLSMRYARRKKGPVLARSHPKKPARATQCRRSGRRYSHWFAREVVSNLALVAEVGRTADTGSLTLRWREMDSKFQFRDASPPPTAWAPSFRRVSGGSLSRRNSFIGLPSRRPLGRFRRADYRSAPTRPKPRNRCLSGAELDFRIHFPPAESHERTGGRRRPSYIGKLCRAADPYPKLGW